MKKQPMILALDFMLPPHRFYYLHNFCRAMQWVQDRYGDLLTPQDQKFLNGFFQQPQPAQALLVRMLMRKGPWFRASKLRYEEIGDMYAASQPLLKIGWLQAQQPMEIATFFGLYTKPELLSIFPELPLHAGMRKDSMLEILESLYPSELTHSQWHPNSSEPVWHITISGLVDRLRLMFFGNLRQEWSEFVLAELGVFQYESVAFDASSRAFQSYQDVEQYAFLHACRKRLQDGEPVALLLASVLQCDIKNSWIQKRRDKLLLQLGKESERSREWAIAETAYRHSSYPGARIRRIRVLEHAREWQLAWDVAQEVRAGPENEEELQRVQRMLPRLRRALKLPTSPRCSVMPSQVVQLCHEIDLERPASNVRVEYVLRNYWHTSEAPVFYVENTLVNSLFGLLFWPAIFAPLPGAFFHPFQSGPADLFAPDFMERRAFIFDACFKQLKDGSYRDVVRARYLNKHGVQSPFVFWNAISKELLELALTCIPPKHLEYLFTRLLCDVKSNRTGFPDLVRFWPAEQRYALVEVKAPGDKLQDNQIRWLEYGVEKGLPMQVYHVKWIEPIPKDWVDGEKVTP